MKMKRAGLVLALVTFGPVPAARADDWASLGFSGDRARFSGERSGAAFGPDSWQRALPADDHPAYQAIFASPAIADGVLLYATQRNLVRALREYDGQVLWQATLGGPVYGSPAIRDGHAFIPGGDRRLTAVRLDTGAVIWQRELGGLVNASPVVVDDSLLVAVGQPAPRVLRLSAATGETLWEAGPGHLQQAADASLAVADGHVLAGETGGAYHAFALASGAWEWTARTGGLVDLSSPLVKDGRVYVLPGGPEPRLHALDAATGEAVAGWPITLPAPPPHAGKQLLERTLAVSSPAGAAGLVLIAFRADERWDGDGDGQADLFVADEVVLAVNASGQQLWAVPNGHRETADANELPTHGFCPTPALYRGTGTQLLVAIASSLQANLRVLDGAGAEQWSAALSAPSRSSPVFANGRLVISTDSGVVHSFASAVNQPPRAPVLGFSPAGGAEVDPGGLVLRWGAAVDLEGDQVRYEVRVDDDGEVLHDWDARGVDLVLEHLDVAGRLESGRVYTFAVRARDNLGAWSAWSRSETFSAVGPPPVAVDGQPAASLPAAVAAAGPGSVITLGHGVYALTETLQLPAGVTLAGAGPHLTTLRGEGLPVAVAAGPGSQLQQLTVTGARIGVAVAAAPAVELRNVILRDNAEAGLHVGPGGRASVVNATLLRNGTGLRADGPTGMRNTLVTANDSGIVATAAMTSRYNDVFANRTQDLLGTAAAPTDLSVTVLFGEDTRLHPAQPTTDQGDPADDFQREPAPNGGRINIGAFGNTPFAELSADIAPGTDGGADAGPSARWDVGCQCNAPGAAHHAPGAGLATAVLAFVLLRRRRRP